MGDDNEYHFIATVLLDEKLADRALIMGVKHDWFNSAPMKTIWKGIVQRRCMDEICDFAWASNYLKEKMGKPLNGRFTHVFGEVLTPAREMMSTYEILHKNYMRRQLQANLNDTQRGLYSEHPGHLIDKLIKDLTALKMVNESPKQPNIRDEILRQLTEGVKIRTGFPRFDYAFKGIEPSLRVIAGFSQHCKTALALNIALNVAQQNQKVVLFSGETNAVQLVKRIMTMLSSINPRWHLSEEEKAEFMRYAETAEKLPISLMEASSLPAIRMEIQKHTAPLYIIDYLQIIDPGLDRRTSREQQIEYTSHELQRLKREYDVCIIVLSAFNRSEWGEEPTLKSIRGSSAIEYDADQVTLLWRASQTKSFSERKKIQEQGAKDKEIEAFIAKDKIHGSDGQVILLEFDPKTLRMKEVEDEEVL